MSGGASRDDLDAQHQNVQLNQMAKWEGFSSWCSLPQVDWQYTLPIIRAKGFLLLTNEYCAHFRQSIDLKAWAKFCTESLEKMAQFPEIVPIHWRMVPLFTAQICAGNAIEAVIKSIQLYFPRGKIFICITFPKYMDSQKWGIICVEFGCDINFYGGPGKGSHKTFVKTPGLKT